MPTLDWLNRDAAFRTAAQVPTRVLRPHRVGHVFGAAASAAAGQSGPSGPDNLLIQGDNRDALQQERGMTMAQQTQVALG